MSHYVRERADRDWYRGLKIPHTVIRNIDEKTKKAVSGTGGTYNPSSPIIIGGAGIELQCALQLSGSPGAKAQPAAGRVFRFGANDYFKHASAVSRSINDTPLLLLSNKTLFREAQPVMSVSATTAPALRTRRAGAFLRMPLRLPDGARLASVEIGYKIGQAHANVPENLPKARVVRIAATGGIEQHPLPSSSVFDVDGWVSVPTPASGAAYYNGGALQTFTLNYIYSVVEPVNTSLYAYAVEWLEESGTNSFTNNIGSLIPYLKSTFYQDDLRPY